MAERSGTVVSVVIVLAFGGALAGLVWNIVSTWGDAGRLEAEVKRRGHAWQGRSEGLRWAFTAAAHGRTFQVECTSGRVKRTRVRTEVLGPADTMVIMPGGPRALPFDGVLGVLLPGIEVPPKWAAPPSLAQWDVYAKPEVAERRLRPGVVSALSSVAATGRPLRVLLQQGRLELVVEQTVSAPEEVFPMLDVAFALTPDGT